MFDIAPSELLIVAVVALIAIGPKDLPMALRTLGRWIGKMRRVSGHFRAGVETMIREAELAEIEKEWQERNARIMAEHPDAAAFEAPVMQALPPAAGAEARLTGNEAADPEAQGEEPELPLPPRGGERG